MRWWVARIAIPSWYASSGTGLYDETSARLRGHSETRWFCCGARGAETDDTKHNAKNKLQGPDEEPGYRSVQPTAKDQPDDGGDENVEGGLEVPGVALRALQECGDEVPAVREEGVDVRVSFAEVSECGCGLLECFLGKARARELVLHQRMGSS
jgi:hypothetical protein